MSEQQNQKCHAKWLMTPGVLGHIIDSYAGIENVPHSPRKKRRVFEWVEEETVVRGNVEAFTLHLSLKFGLNLGPEKACFIHAVLRELGEVVGKNIGKRAKPDKNSPDVGKFSQPKPDKRYVRPARRH